MFYGDVFNSIFLVYEYLNSLEEPLNIELVNKLLEEVTDCFNYYQNKLEEHLSTLKDFLDSGVIADDRQEVYETCLSEIETNLNIDSLDALVEKILALEFCEKEIKKNRNKKYYQKKNKIKISEKKKKKEYIVSQIKIKAFEENKSNRQIARELGISKDTVAKNLEEYKEKN